MERRRDDRVRAREVDLVMSEPGRWFVQSILLPAVIGLASAWSTVQVLTNRVETLEREALDHETRIRHVEIFAAQDPRFTQEDAEELKREIVDAIRRAKDEARRGG